MYNSMGVEEKSLRHV